MSDREVVISHIREAFAGVEYPGDEFLQGDRWCAGLVLARQGSECASEGKPRGSS